MAGLTPDVRASGPDGEPSLARRAWLRFARDPSLARRVSVTRDLAVIAAFVGICYWLVWPVGEYAILDDWAFNKSLSILNERGELRILHWNPMSLAGHLLWGWLFCKLFGVSFTITKLSVVVLHVVELLAWFKSGGFRVAGAQW